MPDRIQLRRTKGWRKPDGAIVVARPSRWGNPYRIGSNMGTVFVHIGGAVCWETPRSDTALNEARAEAVRLFRTRLEPMPYALTEIERIRAELGDSDLACWCPIDAPCHADVLLELANPPEATHAR